MENVRRMRREKGLSQQELADLAGVGQDSISAIETGKHEPHPRTLRKLAKALDAEVADFFKEHALPLAEAPGTGPSLLDEALTAAFQDETKTAQAVRRLVASEGTLAATNMMQFEEDRFRAKLRARGFPDEDFEGFIWPLVTMVDQQKQEIARLKEEISRLRKEVEQESVHR